MAVTNQQLLGLLADGGFHSGDALGQALGVTRAAVWKQVRCLQEDGFSVDAVRGKGYRLRRPVELLAKAAITRSMKDEPRRRYPIEIHYRVESTNDVAARRLDAGGESGTVVLAELQTAGRGRRGRRWISAPAANLYLSMGWRFDMELFGLSGLSLAVGVGVARSLRRCGAGNVALKWPNDLLIRGRKVGGILVDVAGEAGGACRAVVGVGVNCVADASMNTLIEQPWTCLEEEGIRPERNQLAAAVIEELGCTLEYFQRAGLAPFRSEWMELDAFRGRPVTVSAGAEQVEGIARGIDAHGLIEVEVAGRIRRFAGGEVSLRAA